jgi:hypothetical protein
MNSDNLFYYSSISNNLPDARLIGYSFASNAIVIGNHGLQEYAAKHLMKSEDFKDGRFILIMREFDEYIIKSDSMGQDIIYYYYDDRFWAVSNSFYYLCKMLRNENIHLSLYNPGIISFFINNGNALGAQPISNNTMISEIKVLPIGGSISISKQENKLKIFKVTRNNRKNTFSQEWYKNLMLEYLKLWRSRISALLSIPNIEVGVDISGGYDSRMVFGMVYGAGVDIARVKFHSFLGKGEDLKVATQISKAFDIELNLKLHNPVTIDCKESYELWKIGNVGSYLPIYLPLHNSSPNVIQFKGDSCGEGYRFFNNRKPGEISSTFSKYLINKSFTKLLINEFEDSFLNLGIDITDDFAMDHHYNNFRSRFHCGRNWYRSLRKPPITPLICPLLFELLTNLPLSYLHTNQWIYDIMFLSDHKLPKIPFDKSEKKFEPGVSTNSDFKSINLKNHNEKDTLEVFCTPESYIHNKVKKEDRMTDERFIELFKKDYLKAKEIIRPLHLFSDSFISEADSELKQVQIISHDLRKSTHLLMVGLVVEVIR